LYASGTPPSSAAVALSHPGWARNLSSQVRTVPVSSSCSDSVAAAVGASPPKYASNPDAVGSVCTVKCTSARLHSQTRAVQSTLRPPSRSRSSSDIASRDDVVYRSRGR